MDTNRVEIDARNSVDASVKTVTVFQDRAEIIRAVKAKLKKGRNEVVLTHLSNNVDNSSVRVNGGTGKAVILEVSPNTKHIKKEDDTTRAGKIQAEIDGLNEEKKKLTEESDRIKKESAWLDDFASKFMKLPGSAATHSSSIGKDFLDITSSSALSQLENFLEFYQKRLGIIDEKLTKISDKTKALDEQLRVKNSELGVARGNSGSTERVNEVLILIECEEDTEVALQLSYVVSGASWTASYDVRVDSNSAALNLTYYGNITNSTNEDWKDVEVQLSTAKPSIGGAPPPLNTKFISIDYGYQQVYRGASSYSNAMFSQAEFAAPQQLEDVGSSALGGVTSDRSVSVLTTKAKDSNTCSTFSIPRSATILSDHKPHKVTIKILKMDAKFTYSVVPQLSPYAYLKASVVNNTAENYPLLAGELLVFLDSNFVAKSSIKATSPGESFAIFLGVDGGIKVEAQPPVHFKNTQGFLSKSNVKDVKHKTVIKNTKQKKVTLTVFEQLPKSTDGQVKVRLTTPQITEQTPSIKLTEANNVRWKIDLDPGKKVELFFEYNVSWPIDRQLNDH